MNMNAEDIEEFQHWQKKIEDLETENKRLKVEIKTLKDRLTNVSGKLNRRISEDHEIIDFGRD